MNLPPFKKFLCAVNAVTVRISKTLLLTSNLTFLNKNQRFIKVISCVVMNVMRDAGTSFMEHVSSVCV